MSACPCGSGETYGDCCGPLHDGAPAPTAERLMRSRYAAYALGRFDYIEATCAGPAASAFDRDEAEAARLGTVWTGLEIIASRKGREKDDHGEVAFMARYRHNGTEATLRERSRFRRVDGRWAYWDRDPAGMAEAPPRIANPGRNDPCPCGSGRKFKKCCGARG